MTNSDKYFRTATDEEITELMFWDADDAEALWCKGWFTCTKRIPCKDCFINWLKQEVKEETNANKKKPDFTRHTGNALDYPN